MDNSIYLKNREIVHEMMEYRKFTKIIDNLKLYLQSNQGEIELIPIIPDTDYIPNVFHYEKYKNSDEREVYVLYYYSKIENAMNTLFNTLQNDRHETIQSNNISFIIVTIHEIKKMKLSIGNFYIEYFNAKDLLFNPMTHKYVPDHHVITPEERDILKKNYNISETFFELPRILKSDPIARFIGLRPNDICKIIRKPSYLHENEICYRYCVSDQR
jgi:DNA-directed RNA polymerase I, II, and III subunit RPABC1